MEASITDSNGTTAAEVELELEVKPRKQEPTEYLVFEAPRASLKKGDALTYIGTFKSERKADARWAAVDADPGLAERIAVEEGKDGGVFLLPIASRNASPELTREEITQVKVRK